MHFTSYSTKTHIVLLDTFISLPKSLKNRLKSVTEATSYFCCLSRAILTTILGAKILRKFAENPSQTCLHTQSRAKIAENDTKMRPKASTKLQNSSPSASKGPQEDQIWPFKTTIFDPNPRLTTHHSQLAINFTGAKQPPNNNTHLYFGSRLHRRHITAHKSMFCVSLPINPCYKCDVHSQEFLVDNLKVVSTVRNRLKTSPQNLKTASLQFPLPSSYFLIR